MKQTKTENVKCYKTYVPRRSRFNYNTDPMYIFQSSKEKMGLVAADKHRRKVSLRSHAFWSGFRFRQLICDLLIRAGIALIRLRGYVGWSESLYDAHFLSPWLIYDLFVVNRLILNRLTELQLIGGIEDNSKIIFLISQWKHMLWPLFRTVSTRRS